jgi:hypothetical protein
MYTPWRKLETGEIIYRPWKRFGSAYIVDKDSAREIVAYTEATLTIYFPIIFGLTTAWTPNPTSLMGMVLIISEMMLVAFILSLLFNYTTIKNLTKLEKEKSIPDSQIYSIYPISNKSGRFSAAIEIGLGLGLSQGAFIGFGKSLSLFFLTLFLIYIAYGAWNITRIRIEDWSPDPVL